MEIWTTPIAELITKGNFKAPLQFLAFSMIITILIMVLIIKRGMSK